MKIIITGAQCAGKTTVIESLKKSFNTTESGHSIQYYPEAAIQVIDDLIANNIEITQDTLQERIYLLQTKVEEGCDPFVVNIFDRSLRDGLAYHPGYYASHLPKINLQNYDMVIMLTSLAFKPELYDIEAGKTNRIGTREDTIKQHETLLNLYRNHERFILLPLFESLTDLVEAVKSLINDLCSIEREKKYEVSGIDYECLDELIKLPNFVGRQSLETYYLNTNKRIRITDGHTATLTQKDKISDFERKETHSSLTTSQLAKLISSHPQKGISKVRYYFNIPIQVAPLKQSGLRIHFEGYEHNKQIICEVETLASWDLVEDCLQTQFPYLRFTPAKKSDYDIWTEVQTKN